jgi:hypothetical protein
MAYSIYLSIVWMGAVAQLAIITQEESLGKWFLNQEAMREITEAGR